MKNFWWCNQTRAWDLQRRHEVVCSTDMIDTLLYRNTVGQVEAGDIIIHYKAPHIVALSRARRDGRYYVELPLMDGIDYGSGWRFKSEYYDLTKPIDGHAVLEAFTGKHAPIDRDGDEREGYLFPLDDDAIYSIVEHSSIEFSSVLRTLEEVTIPTGRIDESLFDTVH